MSANQEDRVSNAEQGEPLANQNTTLNPDPVMIKQYQNECIVAKF